MCDVGRFGYESLNDRQTRLLEPQARVKGELRSVRWAPVYDAVKQRLAEIGASGREVLGLADTHATNEELFLFRKLIREALGAEHAFFPPRPGVQQETCPRGDVDPFIYTLIQTDKSPNTAGAQALGLTGDADDKRLKAALKAGPKVAVILGAPLAGEKAVTDAVAKAELIVYIGTFESPWSEIADVVLPGHTYAEKEGTFTNKAGRVQRIQAAIRPPEMSRSQLTILQDLLAVLGGGAGEGTAEAGFDAIGQEQAPFRGLTWEGVGNEGATLAGGAS